MFKNGVEINPSLKTTNKSVSCLSYCNLCGCDKYYNVVNDVSNRMCYNCENVAYEFCWTVLREFRNRKLDRLLND